MLQPWSKGPGYISSWQDGSLGIAFIGMRDVKLRRLVPKFQQTSEAKKYVVQSNSQQEGSKRVLQEPGSES